MRTFTLLVIILLTSTSSTAQTWECEILGFYVAVDTPGRSIVYAEETGWNYATKVLVPYTPVEHGVFAGVVVPINPFLFYLPEDSERELYVETRRSCKEPVRMPVDSVKIVLGVDGVKLLRSYKD